MTDEEDKLANPSPIEVSVRNELEEEGDWLTTREIWKWVAIVFALYVVGAVPLLVFGVKDKAGYIGDAFGAINALFSGLAFGFVILNLFAQRYELRKQRQAMLLALDESERARAEYAKMAKAQEVSGEQLQKQSDLMFVSSYLSLLDMLIQSKNQRSTMPVAGSAFAIEWGNQKETHAEVIMERLAGVHESALGRLTGSLEKFAAEKIRSNWLIAYQFVSTLDRNIKDDNRESNENGRDADMIITTVRGIADTVAELKSTTVQSKHSKLNELYNAIEHHIRRLSTEIEQIELRGNPDRFPDLVSAAVEGLSSIGNELAYFENEYT
ncbi:hypothetical protein [Thalassoroseus pseudoceratinae]|uniref:hypothetical protein n=1 Tax=Thalassoroseus pseudoceratinae TaxID=2713176 RepID=UPI001421B4DD|nr:hypothetical protein [Thalassoroseus pseudoceratinae]